MMSGWAVEMDDGLVKDDGWMDCGWMECEWMDCGWIDDGCWAVDRLMMDGLWRDRQMDQWMDDGWMDNGKKEENLRSPFSCILPNRHPSLTLQSRRGTAVPSTMCCGS